MSISYGTMFLLGLLTILFMYFVIGWAIKSFANKQDDNDCIDNCPHADFWSHFPSLVFHGCCYSKDTIMSIFFCNPTPSIQDDLLDE